VEEGQMNIDMSKYQLQRVQDAQQWYEQVYRTLGESVPISIRYMTLWAVFNALYNIADYPNVSLKKVIQEGEKIKPVIYGSHERDKLTHISKIISKNIDFVHDLISRNRAFITLLSRRRPVVEQPEGITTIDFTHNTQAYKIDLSQIWGIASLDNRKIQEDGTVLFQYASLDSELNPETLIPEDPKIFTDQIIFMLYQLRNNIVHGGSTAFFMEKTRLSSGAIHILNDLVRYLLDQPQLLQQESE